MDNQDNREQFAPRQSEIFKTLPEIFPLGHEIYDFSVPENGIRTNWSKILRSILRKGLWVTSAVIFILMVTMEMELFATDFYGIESPENDFIVEDIFLNTTIRDLEKYNIELIPYTIKRGDTLWDIAERYMGNGMGYHVIAEENKIENPDLIFPGEVINVPILSRPVSVSPKRVSLPI